jgi:hypothetical protein
MLRIAAVIAVVAACPAVALAARQADAPATPALVAKVVSCDVTSDPRSATFFGRMDTQQAASKMQIRFQLFERLGKGDWNRLDVPALRVWHTSQAGVRRYGWKQTVDALRTGGAYKARIQYRWLSATGTVVDTEVRDTPVCRGPLPNITVGALTVKPGPTADTRSYRVEVSNTGKIDAQQVDVSLSVDRAVLDTITLDSLAPGQTRTAVFTGPVCQNGIRVKADPGNSIGETIEDDNSQHFACP